MGALNAVAEVLGEVGLPEPVAALARRELAARASRPDGELVRRSSGCARAP